MYMCICICMYIYMCIYIHVERRSQPVGSLACRAGVPPRAAPPPSPPRATAARKRMRNGASTCGQAVPNLFLFLSLALSQDIASRQVSSLSCDNCSPESISQRSQPAVESRANLKSISHRCHLREAAFVWELTKETIYLPLGYLQGGRASTGFDSGLKPKKILRQGTAKGF